MTRSEFDRDFWTGKYLQRETGWDMGGVSPPLKAYADQLSSRDMQILIPGAGNAYEAEYLFSQGFTGVHVLDIATPPLQNLQDRCPGFPQDQMMHGDFFAHRGQYDLVLEQTFFCALDPDLRQAYAEKVHELLVPGGKLVGLLFDFPLEQSVPPFGGSGQEYRDIFSGLFDIKVLERCYNSIKPRAGRELFIIFEKKF